MDLSATESLFSPCSTGCSAEFSAAVAGVFFGFGPRSPSYTGRFGALVLIL